MNGVLILDKPADFTSHDVVAKARHILHERRIGHTGTLDPFATGVLVILVGRATRLAQFLTGLDKEYEAIIRLGYATDTGDRTGKPIESPSASSHSPDLRRWIEHDIEEAMSSLTGEIDQVPPMYSAKKRQGRKLYELARRGETVEREPSRVCVHEFRPIHAGAEMIKDNLDGTFSLETRVTCSSGTYVRSLAEDLGKRLGVGAHLAELRRMRVGPFDLAGAITLDDLKVRFTEEALGTVLLPVSAALSHLPLMHLTADDERKARHGLAVKVEGTDWAEGAKIRMCNTQEELIAIGTFDAQEKKLHPRVVLVSDGQ
jgi:tRNA pseudouridine55 synthase